jgi:hypothetical protein
VAPGEAAAEGAIAAALAGRGRGEDAGNGGGEEESGISTGFGDA